MKLTFLSLDKRNFIHQKDLGWGLPFLPKLVWKAHFLALC
jgi:hypothetical protein